MSQRPIYVTFAALMGLLIATVAISYVPLGTANTALAMAIAATKLMLVVIVFMNLHGSTGTTRLAAAAGVLWLSIAMICVMADYHTRGWHEGNERSAQVPGINPDSQSRSEGEDEVNSLRPREDGC